MQARLDAIYRYPVKGLSPEPLPETALDIGRTVPFDRAYAIENGPAPFDPAAPSYLPKTRFLMLMRNDRLARLHTRFDDASGDLHIRVAPEREVAGNLRTAEGRSAIEAFFADYCRDELRGPPRILHADGHSFSDVAAKVVSIINLASVADLENAVGHPVDPLRFRANLYVSGWPAWHEFSLMGQSIRIGEAATLKVSKRIVRCAATEVDPVTGIRDLPIPQALMRAYDHMDCGVYATVTGAGGVSRGDSIVAVA